MPIAAAVGVIVALVGVIVWFAAYLLHFTPFTGIARWGGTVGQLLLDAFLAGLDWAVRQAQSTLDEAAGDLIALIYTPVHWFESHMESLIGILYATASALRTLALETIPRAISTAEGYALGLYRESIAFTTGEIDSLTTYVRNGFVGIYNSLQTAVTELVTDIDDVARTGEAYALALADQTESYAVGLYDSAITFTTAQVAAAERYTAAGLADLTTWTGSELSALRAYIESSTAAVLSYAQVAVAAVATDLADLESECTDNLCSGLGGVASLLNALEDAGTVAALIALMAGFIRDPAAAAADVQAVAAPLADEAVSLGRSLLGV